MEGVILVAKQPSIRDAFVQPRRRTKQSVYANELTMQQEAVMSKLVKGNETERAIEDRQYDVNAHTPFIKNAMTRSMERIRDNSNIMQLLPDTRQAIEIIIGGILSPKDFLTVKLTYVSNNNIFDEKSVTLLQRIENHFTSSYKLPEKLPRILEDILSRTGSYPVAVLPETSVDFLINSNVRVTTESLSNTYSPNGQLKTIGILANKKTDNTKTELSVFDMITHASTESFTGLEAYDGTIGFPDLLLSVTDNYDALKMPILSRKTAHQQQHARVTARRYRGGDIVKQTFYSSEAIVAVKPDEHERKVKDVKELNKIYPDRLYNALPVQRVKPRSLLEKPTVGHPLDIKLPTEAVIPVFSPTDPSDHIGYFVALDHTGNPVRLMELENIYRMLVQSSNASGMNTSVTSTLLQNAVNGMGGATGAGQYEPIQAYEQSIPIYTQMVEAELIDRLERGVVGTGVSLGRIDDVYRIMLARALMGKRTQLLYLPSTILSYIATDYDEYGLGKTLLDDSKTLAAIRSMQLFVNSMASAKNAITRRTLNARLDPAEKNPQRAEEIIINEFIKGTQSEYPLTNNPADQISYLQKAGIQVNFEEHPRLPQTQVSVDYTDNQYKQIDTDFDEWLKNMHSQSMGLSPEVVEGAGRSDFATQAIFQNVMTTRRIKMLSDKFCRSLSDFIRKYVFNSQILMDDLVRLVQENGWKFKNQFGEAMTDIEVATLFVESVQVTLPLPNLKSLEEQLEAFNIYKSLIEEAMNYFFSSEFLTEDMLGQLADSGYIDSAKNFLVSKFLRDWMAENGVLPELFEALTLGKDGKPLINLAEDHEEYMRVFSEVFLPLAEKRLKRKKETDEAMDKLNEENGGDDYGSGGDDYGATDEESGESDFDEEGGDDEDFGDEFGDEGDGESEEDDFGDFEDDSGEDDSDESKDKEDDEDF